MESTWRGSGASRISTAASALYGGNQSLIAGIRKSISTFRAIAVDLGRNVKDDKVKRLEEAMLELLQTYDDSTRFSDVIKSLGNSYQPSDQPTNFRKALEDEVTKTKAASRSYLQSNPLYRSFKEAVWYGLRTYLRERSNNAVHNTKKPQPTRPIGGCPRILQPSRVVCDPELLIEIEEMRSANDEHIQATAVEDFTEIDDE